jgi:ADP-heptose:LPS heptosyltransferase
MGNAPMGSTKQGPPCANATLKSKILSLIAHESRVEAESAGGFAAVKPDGSVATADGYGATDDGAGGPNLDNPAALEGRRLVVTYGEGLGDAVMSLPALRALSVLFQERLTLVGPTSPKAILEPELPLCCFIERTEANDRRIRRAVENCDLVMNANPIDPIGWAKRHESIVHDHYAGHFSDRIFELPRYLNSRLAIELFSFPPRLGRHGQTFARSVYREIPPGRKVLVVHPDTMASKMWPLERFAKFLDLFLALHPEFVVLVVGLMPTRLESVPSGDRIFPCHGIRFAASVSLVAFADLFVGVDSVMLHIADMYRIPSVGIFGASPPERWGCRFTRHRHVVATNQDMARVKEQDVLSATESLWSDTIGIRAVRR